MPDYSKCVIYKLCCKNLDVKEIYVGSTCNFTKRKNKHKTDSSNLNSKSHNSKVYKFIRDNGGFENWDMVMVEEYPCENIMQKVKRERYWCEELKSELNSISPCRDKKEYRQYKKEKLKEYYQDNKEKLIEYQKEYRQDNKEKIKEYRQDNKEKIKEQKKEWYEKNKDAIKQRKKEYRAKKKNELLLKGKE